MPNPSFESYTMCPSSPNNISNLTSWFCAGGSPDYFNACSAPNLFSVPFNFGGYQLADNGSAYAGIITYAGSLSSYREFIGNTLTTSLTVGNKYFISFKVCMSINSGYSMGAANSGSNKIGSKFSTMPYNAAYPPIINNSATFFTNNIISDSVNWTKLSGSFIADSAYRYIAIGNFFDIPSTQCVKYGTNNDTLAYYFLDDICVSTDSVFTSNYNTAIKEAYYFDLSKIKMYPNPSSDFLFLVNDTGEAINFDVFSFEGNKILEDKNLKDENLKIDLRGLMEGIYFIRIFSQNKASYYKFIKK